MAGWATVVVRGVAPQSPAPRPLPARGDRRSAGKGGFSRRSRLFDPLPFTDRANTKHNPLAWLTQRREKSRA
jgi:hypothetical protein